MTEPADVSASRSGILGVRLSPGAPTFSSCLVRLVAKDIGLSSRRSRVRPPHETPSSVLPCVAQQAARVLWEHEAAGSKPAARTRPCSANSAARVPPCPGGSQGFDSPAERQLNFITGAAMRTCNTPIRTIVVRPAKPRDPLAPRRGKASRRPDFPAGRRRIASGAWISTNA